MRKPFLFVILYLIGLLLMPTTQANDLEAREYEIKAAFLLNLGSFVSWPEHLFVNADSLFQVCIVGPNPFGESLEFLKNTRSIQGHNISIQHYKTFSNDLKICHILYVASAVNNLSVWLETLAQYPILTVADLHDFTRQGGMVQFVVRHSKVRLRLAPQVFKRAELKPSSDLIRVADKLD